jgi:death on curing protein
MQYLTPQQVLFIHARLIAETGGAQGLRDIGLLASAVGRPQATFEGQELYPDLFTKAAALLASLILNHPFLDGKKRTGMTAAALFLQQNGQLLQTSNSELESFTLRVANGGLVCQRNCCLARGKQQRSLEKRETAAVPAGPVTVSRLVEMSRYTRTSAGSGWRIANTLPSTAVAQAMRQLVVANGRQLVVALDIAEQVAMRRAGDDADLSDHHR